MRQQTEAISNRSESTHKTHSGAQQPDICLQKDPLELLELGSGTSKTCGLLLDSHVQRIEDLHPQHTDLIELEIEWHFCHGCIDWIHVISEQPEGILVHDREVETIQASRVARIGRFQVDQRTNDRVYRLMK